MTTAQMERYLADCRALTVAEIRRVVPRDRQPRSELYELVLDYPLRAAKGLRPSLCVAACRALGGTLEAVLPSAAALELYHNAFLLHDDVEDGSESRRGVRTLHASHGSAIAINVGDAMLALALQPLLDNTRLLGLGRALRILQVIARMARESTEGQAMELEWIRRGQWDLRDDDYVRMVYKKTSWYTFITPVTIGAIAAQLDSARTRSLRAFAGLLGIAFQIQDDVLNLQGEGERYGKEAAGDLWEGKHTLIALHMMRSATPREREHARTILAKPRPSMDALGEHGVDPRSRLGRVLSTLAEGGELSARARATIEQALNEAGMPAAKEPEDIRVLVTLIERYGSLDYARRAAHDYARRAGKLLERADWVRASVHRDFLGGLVEFVTSRDW